MKRPQALPKSIYLEDMDNRRVIRRPKQMETDPTHNLPENLEKAVSLLRASLGDKWVSCDDGITAGYARDQGFKHCMYPDIVALPGSTEEVAQVFQIANECLVDVMPYGTGCNTVGLTIPLFGGIILDGRRMDKILEIDRDHLYARIQPGVNYCMLQAEAQKRGMRVANPSAPATVSVVSNHLFCNINTMASKFGFGMDNVIEAQVVLPTGEILEVGPRAHGMDPAQVSGFGPDMANLLRYAVGTLGYVTEMTIRLYSTPEVDLEFYPAYPDDDLTDLIEALYRLAHDNQTLELAHLQNTFYGIFMGSNNKETEAFVDAVPRNNIMAHFGGVTEEEARIKVEHAQEMVQDVSEKFFFIDPQMMREMVGDKIHLDRWNKYFRETVRVQRVRGSFIIGALVNNLENFYEVEKSMREGVTNQIGTTHGIFRPDDASAYFQPYHMGRMAYLEFDLYTNQDDKDDFLRAYMGFFRAIGVSLSKGTIMAHGVTSLIKGWPGLDLMLPLAQPELDNLMSMNIALKQTVDPNNICNRRWEYDTGLGKKRTLF